MRRKEFMARVWARLRKSQKEEKFFEAGKGILAAVSGGPDSTCLAHYLYSMRLRFRFPLEFAYIHHGLRKEAALEAAFVRSLGKKWKVPVSVLRIDVRRAIEIRGKGLEEACRKLRYQTLVERAEKLGFPMVAVGHQMDDQAETALLNLLRGVQLKALGAMPPRRFLSQNVELIRPLLSLKRSEVLEYLKIHNLSFQIDQSNEDLKLTRNWIRHKVLPLLEEKNPRIREHLSGIARQVRSLKSRE